MPSLEANFKWLEIFSLDFGVLGGAAARDLEHHLDRAVGVALAPLDV